MFEVVEYRKDKSGNEKIVSTYCIESGELSRTIKRLDRDVRDGVISDYEIAKV